MTLGLNLPAPAAGVPLHLVAGTDDTVLAARGAVHIAAVRLACVTGDGIAAVSAVKRVVLGTDEVAEGADEYRWIRYVEFGVARRVHLGWKSPTSQERTAREVALLRTTLIFLACRESGPPHA